MPVKMHIMPDIGLSYLHYSGHITTGNITFALTACATHPAFKSHFRHIADLSDVSSFENDYLGIMKAQANAIGMLRGDVHPSLCVFLTPTVIGQTLATIVARSWEAADDPIIVILPEEEQVEATLGLHNITITQMRAAAAPLLDKATDHA